jgi:hypothetical protein
MVGFCGAVSAVLAVLVGYEVNSLYHQFDFPVVLAFSDDK